MGWISSCNCGKGRAQAKRCELRKTFSGLTNTNSVNQQIVLEIGPGTGNLTAKILEKAKKCIAVELDPRMAAEVTKRFQSTPYQKRLEVILGDVMKTELPYFDVCISNTPYQVYTTPDIFPRFFPSLTESRSLLLSHSSSLLHLRRLVPAYSCKSPSSRLEVFRNVLCNWKLTC